MDTMAVAKRFLVRGELARRMRTERASISRLLDPARVSITLTTIATAAAALGMSLRVSLAPDATSSRSSDDVPQTTDA